MLTVSELNELADNLETEGLIDQESLAMDGAKAAPGAIIKVVCKVYQKVRPFLEAYTSLIFIPKKWKAPVISFMVILDGLCPLPDL